MNCNEFKALRADLLYAKLEPAETAACQEHLAGCAACRGEYEPIARLQGHLALLPEPNINLDLSRWLARVVADERRTRRRWAWRAALAVAAGLIIAACLPMHWELAGDHLLVRWQQPLATTPAPLPNQEDLAPPGVRPADATRYLALRNRLLSGGEIAEPAGFGPAPAGPLLYREWRQNLPALEQAL